MIVRGSAPTEVAELIYALASGATRAKWVGVIFNRIIKRLHTVGYLRFVNPHRFVVIAGMHQFSITMRVRIAQVAELVDAPASGAGLRK